MKCYQRHHRIRRTRLYQTQLVVSLARSLSAHCLLTWARLPRTAQSACSMMISRKIEELEGAGCLLISLLKTVCARQYKTFSRVHSALAGACLLRWLYSRLNQWSLYKDGWMDGWMDGYSSSIFFHRLRTACSGRSSSSSSSSRCCCLDFNIEEALQ